MLTNAGAQSLNGRGSGVSFGEFFVNAKLRLIGGAVLILTCVVVLTHVSSRRARRPVTVTNPQTPALPAAQNAQPVDTAIARAQKTIQQRPNSPDGYNDLGSAFMQRARETGDFGFVRRAEAAAARSEALAPDNYGALQLQAKLAAANHRFADARAVANRALQQHPRDLEMYGILIDAEVELGNYGDAIEAAQAMVKIRPYAPSYARISYLGSIHGDTAGAIQAMRMAEQSAGDAESSAWCAVHLGDELMNAGQRAEAEHEYDRALFAFPGYHFALAGKARARIAAGDLTTAVDFYRRAQERVPLPDTAIALGNLYTKLGRSSEAQREFDLAEFIEKSGTAGIGTYSRQMAVFWADHGIKLDEALAIAQRERATRADIYTSDALAWCLYKKGRPQEAQTAISEALRLGTRDPQLNYHAGMIYQALGDREHAAQCLKLALEINPTFDILQAEIAKQTLAALTNYVAG